MQHIDNKSNVSKCVLKNGSKLAKYEKINMHVNNLALILLSLGSIKGLVVKDVENPGEYSKTQNFFLGALSSGLKAYVKLEDDINSKLIELLFDLYSPSIKKIS